MCEASRLEKGTGPKTPKNENKCKGGKGRGKLIKNVIAHLWPGNSKKPRLHRYNENGNLGFPGALRINRQKVPTLLGEDNYCNKLQLTEL